MYALWKAPGINKVLSTQKLKIDRVFFKIDELSVDNKDPESELTIQLKTFMFEEHFTESMLTFVGICHSTMAEKIFQDGRYELGKMKSNLLPFIFNMSIIPLT
ncbi:MAG: hypothetical protein MRZ79_27225 [Bacteroidia bacterium]|nr:hypothetical protein [Bacteroidia bacterium]